MNNLIRLIASFDVLLIKIFFNILFLIFIFFHFTYAENSSLAIDIPANINQPLIQSSVNANQSQISIEERLEILRARIKIAQDRIEKAKLKNKGVTSNQLKENVTDDYVDPDTLSEQELYQKLFGINKPKETPIEMEVSVMVDSILRGTVILNTNTITSFFKFNKDDFLSFIKPFLKKKANKKIKKNLKNIDFVNDQWLEKNNFSYFLRASSGVLEITTPENLRDVQIIDFNRDQFFSNQIASSKLKPSFFSGYSNMVFERNNSNYMLSNESFNSNHFTIDNHFAFGNIFIDSNYKFKDNDNYFEYLELNSFFFTDKYFTRIGFLQEKPLFGINFNTTFSNSLNSKFKKSKQYSFEINKNAKLSIFVNNKLTNTKDLFKGKYKVRNFPQGSGLNKIRLELEETSVQDLISSFDLYQSLEGLKLFYKFNEYIIESDYQSNNYRTLILKNNKNELSTLNMQIVSQEIKLNNKLILNPKEDLLTQKKEIIKKYSFSNYKAENLLQPLENRFKIIAGTYDNRATEILKTNDFSQRINVDDQLLFIENELGLFSLTRYLSNITALTKFSYSPYLRELDYTFRTGTLLGIITGSFIQSHIKGSPYIGKRAKIQIPIPVHKHFDNFQKWAISISKQNPYYKSFSPAVTPLEENPRTGKTSIDNIFQFKQFGFLKFPFILSQSLTIRDSKAYSFKNTFMTAYSFQENMILNLGISHEMGDKELVTLPGFSFNLSFSYQRNAQNYPGNLNINYSSASNTLLYNSVIQLVSLDKNAMSVSFDSDKANLNFSNSSRGFKNSLTYSTSASGDSLSLGSSLSNSRTKSSFSYSKKFSGEFDNSNNLKVRTTLYAVGRHLAIGPTSEQKSITILRKHPLLKDTLVVVNDMYPLDALGPMGLGILTPSKENSLTLSFDNLPNSIDITEVNINILPEYGRGYYKYIGKKSSLFVFGKLIDQDNAPISLMYLEVTGMEDNETNLFFTNSKGGFEFQIDKKQPYLIKVVDYNSDPYLLELTDDQFNEGGYLKLPPIQLIRKLD